MSSNTSNLNLYKADPVADGNNTFNIKTILNDNWDKIDASVAGKEPIILTKNTAFNQSFETSTSNIKMNSAVSVGTSNNVARADHVHPSDTTKANLASPTFTGTLTTPALSVTGNATVGGTLSVTGVLTAPTATAGTNTTQVATTAFVGTAIANLVASAPATLNTLNELATALGDDPNFATTVTNNIATKAPIANPTFTGIVTTPVMSLGGHVYSSDGSERQIRSSVTNGYGFFVNSSGFGGYDWTNNRGVFGYGASSNILNLMPNGGTVTTKNNTLDDGSGNMTVSGINVKNATYPLLTFQNSSGVVKQQIITDVSGGNMYIDTPASLIVRNAVNGATAILTVANNGSVTTKNNTLDDGSGNATVAGSMTSTGYLISKNRVVLNNQGTATTSTQMTGVGATGTWFASSAVGDTAFRNDVNTNILFGFYGTSANDNPALKLTYVSSGVSKVFTQRNTLDDGTGNIYVGNALFGTASNFNIAPASNGQVGLTNNARSKWGMRVVDNSTGNPQAFTYNNTLDDGTGNQVVVGDIQVGTTSFILSHNGLPTNGNKTYGALGQWNDGVGVQAKTNAGTTTNDIFAVLTNDAVNYLSVKNGGTVRTKNNTLDDGNGNITAAGKGTFSGGIRVPSISMSASGTIPISALGSLVTFSGGSGQTLTMPTITGTMSGQTLTIWNNSGYSVTIATAAEFIGFGFTGSTSFTLNNPQIITLVCDGYNWIMKNGTQIGSSGNVATITSGGYKIQTGSGSINCTSSGNSFNASVTFPVAFSSTPLVYGALSGGFNSISCYINVVAYGTSTTGFTMSCATGTAQTVYFNWIAIGS